MTGPSPSPTVCSTASPTRSLTVASVIGGRFGLAGDADAVAEPLEPGGEPARELLDQEDERRLGGLELVALVFEVLDPVEDPGEQGGVLVEAVLAELLGDVRLAGQLADQDPALVADGAGVDVLVAAGVLADAVDVHPPLVGEGAGADEGLAGPEVHVGRLVDEPRHLGQPGEAAGLEEVVPFVLEGQVGDDAAQVDVPAALADPVDGPLDLGRPLADRGQGVGHGELAVVVGVDADRDGEGADDLGDGRGDPFGQGPAVGVAEDEPVGAGGDGGFEGLQGVVGVGAEAVEEVLGVVDDLGDPAGAEGDGVGDHPAVFFERDAEDLGRLEVPALADHGDDRRPRADQGLHPGIVLGGDVAAAGHPEGGDLAVRQVEVARGAEERLVLGVGEGIAPLDVVDAQLVEPLGDPEFVLEREVDPFPLAPVAQGRVVDRDPSHGR